MRSEHHKNRFIIDTLIVGLQLLQIPELKPVPKDFQTCWDEGCRGHWTEDQWIEQAKTRELSVNIDMWRFHVSASLPRRI